VAIKTPKMIKVKIKVFRVVHSPLTKTIPSLDLIIFMSNKCPPRMDKNESHLRNGFIGEDILKVGLGYCNEKILHKIIS
jgi:hypothetical protein